MRGWPASGRSSRAAFAGTELRMDPIPDVGEHTDAILAELGYDAAAIAALREAEAV